MTGPRVRARHRAITLVELALAGNHASLRDRMAELVDDEQRDLVMRALVALARDLAHGFEICARVRATDLLDAARTAAVVDAVLGDQPGQGLAGQR